MLLCHGFAIYQHCMQAEVRPLHALLAKYMAIPLLPWKYDAARHTDSKSIFLTFIVFNTLQTQK